MVISRCGHHGLHVPMLVEEQHYGHENVIVPTQHLQMAGKTARDRAFNLNFAKSKRVEVSYTVHFLLKWHSGADPGFFKGGWMIQSAT